MQMNYAVIVFLNFPVKAGVQNFCLPFLAARVITQTLLGCAYDITKIQRNFLKSTTIIHYLGRVNVIAT